MIPDKNNLVGLLKCEDTDFDFPFKQDFQSSRDSIKEVWCMRPSEQLFNNNVSLFHQA